MMLDTKANAKLSFLLAIVAYEILILPAANLPNGADEFTVSFVVLLTIAVSFNYITYHETFEPQPISVIISVSFLLATAIYMFIAFVVKFNLTFKAKPNSFVLLMVCIFLTTMSAMCKIVQYSN